MTAFPSNYSLSWGWKKIQVSTVFFALITGVANPDLVLDRSVDLARAEE